MRFGLGPFSAEAYAGMSETEAYEVLGSASELAERSGFESFWIAERHFSEDGYCPASLVAGAYVAARTESLRIAVMPILGLTHPLYVAEDAATLDNASGGRAIIVPVNAVGHELAGYGLDPADYVGRFEESLDVLQAAWSARPFRHEGRYWQIPAELDGHTLGPSGMVTATPKPAQFQLPLWIGGFWEQGRLIAARRGLPMVVGAISRDSEVGSIFSAYAASAPAGTPRIRTLIRDVYVSAGVDPRAECSAMLGRQMERYRSWGLWNGDAADPSSYGAIVGSPDEVIAQIRGLDEIAGIDHLVCRMHFPGMPFHQLLASMQLMSREVIPEFRMPDLPRQIREGVR
jgi:alkanesulfonate monooxygenase SsuD/methylene tetrahydromethanopterin reductase-like flavin-dependent oxidoreductase (luciferase family)